MANKTGRLIDYGQVLVLEKNVQGNVLWIRFLGHRLRHIQHNTIAQPGQVPGFFPQFIDPNISFSNPILDLRTALAVNPGEQKPVEANPNGIRLYDPKFGSSTQL
jgi:hypothetical protein